MSILFVSSTASIAFLNTSKYISLKDLVIEMFLEYVEGNNILYFAEVEMNDVSTNKVNFRLPDDGLNDLSVIAEKYLRNITSRKYKTLAFYKTMADD